MAVGIARVRLRERGRPSGLVLARPPRVRRAPVPAALYLRRMGASAASGAALLPDALAEPAVQARRRAALPGLARRARRGPASAPSTTITSRIAPTGMFGFLELEDAPDILPPLLEAAASWLRAQGRGAHDRPDGLHDERRVRRPDSTASSGCRSSSSRGTRPTTRSAARRPGSTRPRTCSCTSSSSRTARRSCPSSSSSPSGWSPGTASRSGARRGARCAGPGPLRRGLQRGLERELGLRAVHEARPRRVRPGDAARLRPQLGHGRRDRRRARRRRSRSRSRTSTRCW